jgi:Phytanoyl-CoA dioxygenase (PhyH)
VNPVRLDRRTRDDSELRDLEPAAYFDEIFAEYAEDRRVLAADGVRHLGARSLSLDVDGCMWSFDATEELQVSTGPAEGAVVVRLTRAQFSDWVQQQTTFSALLTARAIERPRGASQDLAVWDAAWLALLEGWPVIDEGLTFRSASGAPLDLERAFGPEDPPEEAAHFLREAGYVHLRGWLEPDRMDEIGREIDRAVTSYTEGDGRSWWATVDGGARRCVRLQQFVEHSPATAAMLASESWQRVREAVGGHDHLTRAPIEGNCIEALIKPLSVVEGISDVPWHRDCNFGRHAYSCAGIIAGISVDPGNEHGGMLRVVAGSHRVNMPAYRASNAPYLPVVPLVTQRGDITVHQSCTLHEATPPTRDERRVMYTGFGLPPRVERETSRAGGDAIWKLRNEAHTLVSQPRSPVAGSRG